MSNLAAGVCRELVIWIQKRYNLKEFIETGTFQGDSTAFAATLFDYVLSIEINADKWAAACNRFEKQEPPIDLWYGDSAELMQGAMQQLDGRALIWLDAHNVAGQFGDEDSCPVLAELYAITCDTRDHIIIIDDAHCFMPPLPAHLTPEAWPVLSEIEELATKGGYQVHITHDLIILALPEELHEIKAFIETLPVTKRAIMRKVACKAEAINGPMKKGTVPSVLPAFTGLVYTNYGWMLVHRFDPNQTPALTQAGVSRDHAAIEHLGSYLKDIGYGAVFVDIGAHIGTYSFGVRRFCAEIHAFEPQRIIYNMMCGSVALNGWLNIHCYNVALGRSNGTIEVPNYDYNKPLSFGSIEFGGEQKEKLVQEQRNSPFIPKETVPLKQLDEYALKRVDVMKIDVEGMELAVLAGAHETIVRCRPIIMIEHLKSDKAILYTVIESMGYVVQDYGDIDFLCFPLK